MCNISDLEDYTTDQLRTELFRRQKADERGECWYCNRNYKAHTCKYANPTPCPGWVVDPPRLVDEEDWKATARNPVSGKVEIGCGSVSESHRLNHD